MKEARRRPTDTHTHLVLSPAPAAACSTIISDPVAECNVAYNYTSWQLKKRKKCKLCLLLR
jgi:hypothetical protein